MSVDIGEITKENVKEFAFRLNFYERVFGTILLDTEFKDKFITLKEIEEHIGLSTNVITLSRSKWMKRVLDVHSRELTSSVERWIDGQLVGV